MAARKVCIGEHLTTVVDGPDEMLQMAKWSVPRLVFDEVAASGGDGSVLAGIEALPGKLMIDKTANWINDSPIKQRILIRVTRFTRTILTSNPNAIQFRDRWTYAVDDVPTVPIVTGIFNSQSGRAFDIGTNTVAEPNPGRLWHWAGMRSSDEWVSAPLLPGERFRLWYRCYMWTPPPWSDNANKNSPQHTAAASGVRVQLEAHPEPSEMVIG